MNYKTFQEGIAVLSACVVDFRATADKEKLAVWYEMTRDISDSIFLEAVKQVCRNTSNIYPGTNVVGLIHDAVRQINQEQRNKISPPHYKLEEGYTEEQFERGREMMKELISRVAVKND